MAKKTNRFEQFKAECIKLQEVFGLIDWDLDFVLVTEPLDFHAQCNYNVNGKTATLCLNSESTAEVKNLALHEMLEVVLAELRTLAEGMYAQDVVDKATHTVISRIINVSGVNQ